MSTALRRREYSVDNNGVAIHCIDIAPVSEKHSTPIILVPGMTTSADMIADALTTDFSRRCIVVSMRGRGQSQAPDTGYTFHHQVSDIAAVVHSLDISSVALYGHSVGAAFALGFALQSPQSVSALILGDYPPVYPPFGSAWMERVLAHNTGMQKEAVIGIVREAERISLTDRLGEITCPTLVIKGGAESSLLSADACNVYLQRIPDCTAMVLPESGHDLLQPNASTFVHGIEDFLSPS